MYVYYKNPVDDEGTITGDSAASTASDSSVWDSSYTGVYHLDDTSFGSNSVNDSTGNDDLSSLGWDSSASVYGISSLALDFDGNEELDTNNGKNFYNTNGLTVESWIKSDDPTTCNPITTVWKEQNKKRGFNLSVGCTNGKITFQGSVDGTAETTITGSTAISAGNWQHVVGTFDGTNLNLFHNGTLDSSVALASLNKPNGIKLNVGTFVSSSDNFDGVIDELRISDSARDSDYIVTTYNNLASPSTFYSIGVEDDGAPEVPVLDITRTSRNTFTILWNTISDSGAGVLSYFRIDSIVNAVLPSYFNYTSPSDPPNATSYSTTTTCSGDGEFKIRAVNSVRASNFSNTVFGETPACRDKSAPPEILGVGIYDSTTNYYLPPDTDSQDYYFFDEIDDHVTKTTYTDTEFSISTRVAYENGLDDIATYAVYLNNRDFYSSKESGGTSIFFDNGKLDWDEETKPELKITDEHELVKDAHYAVIKNDDEKWMIFNITFEKPMKESDVIIDVWDADRYSRIIKLNGLEVLEKPYDEPTPDEPIPAYQVTVLESNLETCAPECVQTIEMQSEDDSVTWKNVDDIDHIMDLTNPDTGNIFYYTTLSPEMSSTKQFHHEGTFDFTCRYHPWLNGVIGVSEFDSKSYSENLKDNSKTDRNKMIERYAGFSQETVSDEEFLKSFDIDGKYVPKYLAKIAEFLYREKISQNDFEVILSYMVEKQIIR